ncbi:hypothetical protein CSHISOI_04463 [Colletotrichum shisoi]|uniref:Uncharacterized protein n=1 Tax=Colletotrichum shisoi TaxID=2078593 RepID=A0A5Q4BUP7_9PEZI|nr:hypothetical protein CSHISOI_04463 [Colletotrichum shisoi]
MSERVCMPCTASHRRAACNATAPRQFNANRVRPFFPSPLLQCPLPRCHRRPSQQRTLPLQPSADVRLPGCVADRAAKVYRCRATDPGRPWNVQSYFLLGGFFFPPQPARPRAG